MQRITLAQLSSIFPILYQPCIIFCPQPYFHCLVLLTLVIKVYEYFSPPPQLHPCPPVSPWSASLNRASFSFVSNSSPVRILLVFALFQQYFFFLCVPCLVLWRLSFLIGIALRLLSSSACSLPFLHPSSLFSASLAEEDRHQTVWSRVCVCAFMHGWCVCSEFLTSFLHNSMFLVMSPPL